MSQVEHPENLRSDDELVRDLMATFGSVLDRACTYSILTDREAFSEYDHDPADLAAAPEMSRRGCAFVAQVQALVNEFTEGPRNKGNGISEHIITVAGGGWFAFSSYADAIGRHATDLTLSPVEATA